MNRALLVGIDAYPTQPLAGCAGDINNLAALLLDERHFAFGEIRLLADNRATHRAMVDGLRWLFGCASPGDRLYFHFSGHGAQVPSGPHGELFEALCPFDFDWSPEKALARRDLAGLWAALPNGVSLTWTLDASFAGELAPEAARAVAAPRGRTFRAPDSLAREIERRRELNGGARPLLSPRMAERSLLLAACWSDEVASEVSFDGRPRGAFSSALVRTLRRPASARSPVGALPRVLSRDLRLFHQHAVADGPRSAMARPFLDAAARDPIRPKSPGSLGRFDLGGREPPLNLLSPPPARPEPGVRGPCAF